MMGNLSETDALIWGLFVFAQMADIYTTIHALKTPGAQEANGFIAALMAKLGKGWILVKLAVSIGGAYAIWLSGERWMIVALAVLVLGVAVSNYRIARKNA
ncbi:DUF5658 family protein [Sulfitobacter sp. PM12]|uniref:DUF5658 family protein n=1 Tax=Sulfitobacter sp. PM12 TaxID=3138497 RepID=UPI00388DE224